MDRTPHQDSRSGGAGGSREGLHPVGVDRTPTFVVGKRSSAVSEGEVTVGH